MKCELAWPACCPRRMRICQGRLLGGALTATQSRRGCSLLTVLHNRRCSNSTVALGFEGEFRLPLQVRTARKARTGSQHWVAGGGRALPARGVSTSRVSDKTRHDMDVDMDMYDVFMACMD